MTLPMLFEVCSPRSDVLEGRIAESDFAADLARVLRREATSEYQDPVKFFANTHPTRGLRELLTSICQRLTGQGDQLGSIFRLDTNYGGGKTHALIALIHVVNGMPGVTNAAEFLDPALLPRGRVRVAAFDGENADPINGHSLGDGVYAKTPWGELAYALAGKVGYERVRASDEQAIAPGAETLRELFGDEPALILLDELSIYLRKLNAKERERAGGQLTAFLTALFKAVESHPRAALVYTLAIGKDGIATDAYSEENQFIAARMEELMSVSARKATLLDPTEEDETVKVLQRRLFGYVDSTQAEAIITAYQRLWDQQRDTLPQTGDPQTRLQAFRDGFPLHPELIETLRDKTSTLSNFQRVRGMLRLLARSVAQLWQQQPPSTHAIHLHHLDPGNEAIRREIVTKLGLSQFLPAIRADVAGVEGDQPSLAQELDRQHYRGLPPYGSLVGRVMLMHSLAFNESLKGLTPEQLRYSLLSPGIDLSFVGDATRRFMEESAYLDDRPGAPLRFLTEANLTQLIRRQEQLVDLGRMRDELNDEIRQLFRTGGTFELISFPAGPYDVDDRVEEGRPYLAVMGYEGVVVDSNRVSVPDLIQRLYTEKGSNGDPRQNRNNLVFLAADRDLTDAMRRRMLRHIAIRELRNSPTFGQLADYQQRNLEGELGKSRSAAAVAVQQTYRHLFYPSGSRLEGASVTLNHSVIDTPSAAESPGAGQRQIVRSLRESRKLRLPEDAPDAPSYIRDKTLLRHGQISTAALRLEFYRDPALPMLVGNEVFIRGLVQGIEAGLFVYRSGDLLWGKGDPAASIKLDENSYVYTADYASDHGIWPPRPASSPPPESLASFTTPSSTALSGTGRAAPTASSTIDSDGATLTLVPVPPTSPPERVFQSEGSLREALIQVWEQTRSAQVNRLGSLEIQVFDVGDGFTLMGYVRQVPKSTTQVRFEGEYLTAGGSEMAFEFSGIVGDAMSIKDMLAAQLRAATDKRLMVTYSVHFTEGLDLQTEEPEQLTERLSRMGSGAVHVVARGVVADADDD
jgi:hypothetical protein